jgi:hypothetical protein
VLLTESRRGTASASRLDAVKGDPAPGRSPSSAFEKFDRMMRKVVAVPKAELDKREVAYKRARSRKKPAKAPS